MATSLDLTPFGFTPTENLVYGRLLRGGPSSGYAVARDLHVARANIYQALRGLVSKGAAVVAGEHPQRFRAVRPSDLYAGIVQRHADRLDQLEAQLDMPVESGAESFVPLSSERAFLELASRMAAREKAEVMCLAPARTLSALLPAIRKRISDGSPFRIWAIGDIRDFPAQLEGQVPPGRAENLFGCPVAIQAGGDAAVVARMPGGKVAGYWTTDPAVVAATRGSLAYLTGMLL